MTQIKSSRNKKNKNHVKKIIFSLSNLLSASIINLYLKKIKNEDMYYQFDLITHGKVHWISTWQTLPSLNKPERKQQWRHRNMHNPPQTSMSMLPQHTSLHKPLHPPGDNRMNIRGRKCWWATLELLLLHTWLLHSLKSGPVITRHDCSTVTNFTMLSLQGAGIWISKRRHTVHQQHVLLCLLIVFIDW